MGRGTQPTPETTPVSTPTRSQKLKVYGWDGQVRGERRTARLIVATTSFQKVCEASVAAGMGKPGRDYCSVTANTKELEAALEQPGIVLGALEPYRTEVTYSRVENGRIVTD